MGNGFDLNLLSAGIQFSNRKKDHTKYKKGWKFLGVYNTVKCAVIAMLNIKHSLIDFITEHPKSKIQSFILFTLQFISVY